MTSYIYLSSDAELATGSVGDKGVTIFQTTIYATENLMEFFFFEPNYDTDEQHFFSFSKHFSSEKYQVASIDQNLPEQAENKINKRQKKALTELLSYVRNHFNHTNATYIELLFCLNSYENEPLKHKKIIKYKELSLNDLFYEELKFLTLTK